MQIAEALARARALARAAEDEAAKQAYIEILRTDPTNFSALNELGTLAWAGGFRSAARTAYQQAQTMEQKGLVGREQAGKAHLYFARVPRERTYRQLAGSFLDRVFDGAMNEYVVRALESRPASLEELEELERMIAEAKRRAHASGKEGAHD